MDEYADSRRKQLTILIIGALIALGVTAAIIFFTVETRGRTLARLHTFAATLPAYAGHPVAPAEDTTSTCPDTGDGSQRPAVVSRHSDASVDTLSAQADFIAATGQRGFGWQGTGGYAYAVVTDHGKTYEISFPNDDTSTAIMITACD